jgi:hypothetical protein
MTEYDPSPAFDSGSGRTATSRRSRPCARPLSDLGGLAAEGREVRAHEAEKWRHRSRQDEVREKMRERCVRDGPRPGDDAGEADPEFVGD